MTLTSSEVENDLVRYSLSEIQSQCRKAARGAGLTWGLADEAGKAARWLSSFGMRGPYLLARLLPGMEGLPYETLRPVSTQGTWRGVQGPLCPLITGALLSDVAGQLEAGRRIEIASVAFPLFMVPFLGQASAQSGVAFELCWSGIRVLCLPYGICVDGDTTALEMEQTSAAVCRRSLLASATHVPSAKSQSVDLATWSVLEHLAHRTYVPATEASRAGAGSTLGDNN